MNGKTSLAIVCFIFDNSSLLTKLLSSTFSSTKTSSKIFLASSFLPSLTNLTNSIIFLSHFLINSNNFLLFFFQFGKTFLIASFTIAKSIDYEIVRFSENLTKILLKFLIQKLGFFSTQIGTVTFHIKLLKILFFDNFFISLFDTVLYSTFS